MYMQAHTDIDTSFDFLSIDLEVFEAQEASHASALIDTPKTKPSLVRAEVDQAWNNLYRQYH